MRNHDLNPKIIFLFVFLCAKWVFCVRNDIVNRRGAKYPLTDKEKFPSTSKKHYESSSTQKHRVKKEHYGRQNSDGNSNLTSFTKPSLATHTPKHRYHKLKNKLRRISHKRKSSVSLTADKVDKILSIDDETKFVDKVLQLMIADDSDVLKDVSEEEDPSFILTKNDDFNVRQYNFKRSDMHYLAFNSTMPDVMPNYPSIALESLVSKTAPSNTSNAPHDASNTSHDASKASPEQREMKASRVCKPGPPLASNKRLPNCLLIGDSIALSYSYSVAAALQGRCIVQLAPFSSMGVALDSSHGLQCLPLLLSTSNLTPTRFDAIIFNFGLHDVDYSGKFPEEFNDAKKYKRNLGRLKKKFLRTGATVAFVLTTPVTYDKEKNEMVKKYNIAAKKVMAKKPSVDTIDLYQYVVDKCGEPPFANCFMMKKEDDVHYGVSGSILLGKQVAAKFVEILKSRDLLVERGFGLPENLNLSAPLFNLKDGSLKCSRNSTVPTRCPSRMTCVPNQISRTGFGCCPLHNGVDCGDNWHCCPEGMSCHKDCSFTGCKCLVV